MKIAKFDELVEELKNRLKKDEDIVVVEEAPKSNNVVATVLIVLAVLSVVGAGAYFLYKYLKPDYLEDYDEDYEEEDDDVEVED